MKYEKLFALFLLIVFCNPCNAQNKTGPETKNVIPYNGPTNITRNIIQDKKGNVWMASWDGIFRYETRLPYGQGKSFTNITHEVSTARFFSVLEDRKGNLWFGSIGSGVYYYDALLF